MQSANSAVPTPQSIDSDQDRPLYIWLKEPAAPSVYPVYPEDDGTDTPKNPYGQH